MKIVRVGMLGAGGMGRTHAEILARDDLPWWTAWEADLVAVLDAEWANLEAALDFYASALEATVGLRMATDLWPYWVVRGSYRMGRRRIEAFLANAASATSMRSAFGL